MWPFKKNDDKEMEQLRLDLHAGKIKAEDLDEETSVKFLEYMDKRTKKRLAEIAKIEEETRQIEEETEKIREETRQLEEENKRLDEENAELERQVSLLNEISSSYISDLNNAVKSGNQEEIDKVNNIYRDKIIDVVGEDEYEEIMKSLQASINKK